MKTSKNRNKILIIFIIIWFTNIVQSQNPWINAMPMYYNPSFAGSTEHLRVATNNALEINNSNQGFRNRNFISFDKFIQKIHSGLGIQFMFNKEVARSDGYIQFDNRDFEGNVILAPKFNFKGKYSLSPSLKFSNSHHMLRVSSKDSIHRHESFNHNIKLESGILFNSKTYFLGISYKIYNNSTFPLSVSYQKLKPKFSCITGITLRKSEEAKFSFTPILYLYTVKMDNDIMISQKSSMVLFNIALNFKYQSFVGGIDYERKLMLGYENDRLRLMFVQEYNVMQAF